MATATLSERDLLKRMTMTVTIERGHFHPYLMRFGFWIMTIGARIAGVGQVNVIDDRGEQ